MQMENIKLTCSKLVAILGSHGIKIDHSPNIDMILDNYEIMCQYQLQNNERCTANNNIVDSRTNGCTANNNIVDSRTNGCTFKNIDAKLDKQLKIKHQYEIKMIYKMQNNNLQRYEHINKIKMLQKYVLDILMDDKITMFETSIEMIDMLAKLNRTDALTTSMRMMKSP